MTLLTLFLVHTPKVPASFTQEQIGRQTMKWGLSRSGRVHLDSYSVMGRTRWGSVSNMLSCVDDGGSAGQRQASRLSN